MTPMDTTSAMQRAMIAMGVIEHLAGNLLDEDQLEAFLGSGMAPSEMLAELFSLLEEGLLETEELMADVDYLEGCLSIDSAASNC